MADRHNLAPNPALKTVATGWDSGGSTPVRVVNGDFERGFAARFTGGTNTLLPIGSGVTAGLDYTFSVYTQLTSGFESNTGDAYIEWRDSSDDVLSYSSSGYDISGTGGIGRIVVTATAPTNATRARLTTGGLNFEFTPCDFSMLLYEVGDAVGDYFDGDSPGGSWDGADGNSASTLSEGGGGSDLVGDVTASIAAGVSAAAIRATAGGATQAVNRTVSAAAVRNTPGVVSHSTSAAASVAAVRNTPGATSASTTAGATVQATRTANVLVAAPVSAETLATALRDTPGAATPAVSAGATVVASRAAVVGTSQAILAGATVVAEVSGSAQGDVSATVSAGLTATALRDARTVIALEGVAHALVVADVTSTQVIAAVTAVIARTTNTTARRGMVVGAAAIVEAHVLSRVAEPVIDPPAPSGGGWNSLISIYREARQTRDHQRDRVPVACPDCGEPLVPGPDSVIFCTFDGWQYPRDRQILR